MKFSYCFVTVFLSYFLLTSCSTSLEPSVISFDDYLKSHPETHFIDYTSRPDNKVVIGAIKNGKTIIGFSWIDTPVNQIVLLRSADSQCAIKFTSYGIENDGVKATSFDTGAPTKKATIEFYDNATRKLAILPLQAKSSIGLGRLNFGRGEYFIKCGNAKYLWLYPTGIVIFPEHKAIEFSPTTMSDFEHIDFLNKNIKWYKYETGRKIIVLNSDK